MSWKDIGKWLKSRGKGKDQFKGMRNSAILQDLTEYELFLFSQIVHDRKFTKGESIFEQDVPLAVFYMVSSGEVELQETASTGQSSCRISPNEVLGIIDMYVQNRRLASARATKDTYLQAVSHLDFEFFVKSNPKTGVKLLNNMCRLISRKALSDISSEGI